MLSVKIISFTLALYDQSSLFALFFQNRLLLYHWRLIRQCACAGCLAFILRSTASDERSTLFTQHCLSQYLRFAGPSPARIFYKSIAGRYRPVYPDGPITARYRFIMNVYWVYALRPIKGSFANSVDPVLHCFH